METLLTPAQLAATLGLAVQTVYNRRATGGSLPKAILIGSLVRFRTQDIQDWLTSQYEGSLAHELPNDRRVEAPKRHGRPTKAEQIRRRRADGCSAA
ncbi:helix-turn-helix transcriptional regulator [Hydrogenophaga atypica]|uniref:Helix-turn-helix transcriptional regulator n=1 Tax=Hydrogenophaga atypica TaxID=249409 RepID=A0ABW2QPA5_9BURK